MPRRKTGCDIHRETGAGGLLPIYRALDPIASDPRDRKRKERYPEKRRPERDEECSKEAREVIGPKAGDRGKKAVPVVEPVLS